MRLQQKKCANTFTINQLLFVQAHLGNKTSKWNPLTKSFIFGSRHGIHLFDLKQIIPFLKRVIFLLTKATINHQTLFFIGTHPFVNVLIRFLAKNTQNHSISRKWVSGTLTNWLKVRPYIRFLYKTNITQIRKKFILKTEKKIEQKIIQYLKMKALLSGIERMTTIPNIVIILDKKIDHGLHNEQPKDGLEEYPLLESKRLMIPIISVVNTGPRSALNVSYPVFGNDYLFDSLFFYGNLLLQAIHNGIYQKRLHFLIKLRFFPEVKTINFEKKGPKNNMLIKLKKIFRNAHSYKKLAIKRVLRSFLNKS